MERVTRPSLGRASSDILWSLPEGPIRWTEESPRVRSRRGSRAPLSIFPLARAVTGDRVLARYANPPRGAETSAVQEKWLHFPFHSGLVLSSAEKNGDVSCDDLVTVFIYNFICPSSHRRKEKRENERLLKDINKALVDTRGSRWGSPPHLSVLSWAAVDDDRTCVRSHPSPQPLLDRPLTSSGAPVWTHASPLQPRRERRCWRNEVWDGMSLLLPRCHPRSWNRWSFICLPLPPQEQTCRIYLLFLSYRPHSSSPPTLGPDSSQASVASGPGSRVKDDLLLVGLMGAWSPAVPRRAAWLPVIFSWHATAVRLIWLLHASKAYFTLKISLNFYIAWMCNGESAQMGILWWTELTFPSKLNRLPPLSLIIFYFHRSSTSPKTFRSNFKNHKALIDAEPSPSAALLFFFFVPNCSSKNQKPF